MDKAALEQSKQAKREQLAAWRASRTQELSLPSGLTVSVRDASIMDLVINGNIPETLMGSIMNQVGNGEQVDLSMFSSDNEFGKLINEMVKICVVDPPIADVADEDHLALSELSGDDKMAIFNHANREVEQVKTFRSEQNELVDAAQPG